MRRLPPCPAVVPALALALAPAPGVAADFPRFEAQEIDPNAGKVVYAVTVADVNGDGAPDVCALTEDALHWYENPSWARHEVLKGATQEAGGTERDNVTFAPLDVDRDGDLDFAIGADWRPADTADGGTLFFARQDGPDDWTLVPIGAEPTMHRIRWADVSGDGRPELIALPLQGRGTSGPDWGRGAGVRVLVLSIPDDPSEDEWPAEVADDTLHTTHNVHPIDLDGDGRDELVVAAWEGVFLLDREGDAWTRTKLGDGNQEASPFKGSSEVKVGRIGEQGRYIGTVEPWHGHQVVAYGTPDGGDGPWSRVVIDEPLSGGHAVWAADLDGDGDDELIVGHRDPNPDGSAGPKGPGLFVYDPVPGEQSPPRFEKHAIDDGGIAVEDATVADLDGDGRPELIGGGRATHNVRIYWNRPADDGGR